MKECQKTGCNLKPTFKITFTPSFRGVDEIFACNIHKDIFKPIQEGDKCIIECIFIEPDPDLLIQIDREEFSHLDKLKNHT